MSILSLITAPDPILKKVASPVDTVNDSIRQLMDDMLETMYHNHGVGLAAPQVAVSKRIIVLDLSKVDIKEDNITNSEYKYPLFMVNPIVKAISNQTATAKEGCLSLPKQAIEVSRYHEIQVTYLDYYNKLKTLNAEGWLARAIQHEADHLDGILLVDYLSDLKKEAALNTLSKIKDAAYDK
ncbi:peptide deformylase [Orientia tsutsugamushi]|uniref:peptide deformylase n=1 Tax=Orientia tsutsugamushi TaxID=784 RepID=UPI0007E495EC|nr:peptide deformylase [Orientia tsutsugamushi]